MTTATRTREEIIKAAQDLIASHDRTITVSVTNVSGLGRMGREILDSDLFQAVWEILETAGIPKSIAERAAIAASNAAMDVIAG